MNKFKVKLELNYEQLCIINESLKNLKDVIYDKTECYEHLLLVFNNLTKKISSNNIIECEINTGKETYKVLI